MTPGQNSLVPPSGLLPALIIPSGAATLPRGFSDGMLPPAIGTICLAPAFKYAIFEFFFGLHAHIPSL